MMRMKFNTIATMANMQMCLMIVQPSKSRGTSFREDRNMEEVNSLYMYQPRILWGIKALGPANAK